MHGILSEISKRRGALLSVHTLTKPCSYCEGHGYVQLLLGGSETCPYCKGTASEKEQK